MASGPRGDGCFALLLLLGLIFGVGAAYYRNAHPNPDLIRTEGGFERRN